MSTQQLKKDPSMDEILASIREIISEDVKSISTTKPTTPPRRAIHTTVSSKHDILELTDVVDDGLSRKTITYNNNEKKRGEFMTYPTGSKQDEALELSNEVTENDEFEKEKRTVDTSSKKDLNQGSNREAASTKEMSEKILETLAEGDMISAEVLEQSSEALNVLDKLNTGQDYSLTSPTEIKGSQTIEELMSNLLRPMLKNWLDANLPSIVKVIVTEQVEKVMKQRLK